MSRLKIPSIAVDFDGTLTYWNEYTYPYVNKEDLRIDAITILTEYRKKGGILSLFTCRTDYALEVAVELCRKYGLEFDSINCDTKYAIDSWRAKYPRSSLSPKIWSNLYIDDKAWPCNTRGLDWGQIAREILEEVEDE